MSSLPGMLGFMVCYLQNSPYSVTQDCNRLMNGLFSQTLSVGNPAQEQATPGSCEDAQTVPTPPETTAAVSEYVSGIDFSIDVSIGFHKGFSINFSIDFSIDLSIFMLHCVALLMMITNKRL